MRARLVPRRHEVGRASGLVSARGTDAAGSNGQKSPISPLRPSRSLPSLALTAAAATSRAAPPDTQPTPAIHCYAARGSRNRYTITTGCRPRPAEISPGRQSRRDEQPAFSGLGTAPARTRAAQHKRCPAHESSSSDTRPSPSLAVATCTTRIEACRRARSPVGVCLSCWTRFAPSSTNRLAGRASMSINVRTVVRCSSRSRGDGTTGEMWAAQTTCNGTFRHHISTGTSRCIAKPEIPIVNTYWEALHIFAVLRTWRRAAFPYQTTKLTSIFFK